MLDSGGLEHTESRGDLFSVRVEAVCRHPSGLAFWLVWPSCLRSGSRRSPILYRPGPCTSAHRGRCSSRAQSLLDRIHESREGEDPQGANKPTCRDLCHVSFSRLLHNSTKLKHTVKAGWSCPRRI